MAAGYLRRSTGRPALKSLPISTYVLAEWRVRRVSLDYHVEVEKHYYSVPRRFARPEVEVRLSTQPLS
jgi:transposase